MQRAKRWAGFLIVFMAGVAVAYSPSKPQPAPSLTQCMPFSTTVEPWGSLRVHTSNNAKIEPGDEICEINQALLKGTPDSVPRLREATGSHLLLKVRRGDSTFDVLVKSVLARPHATAPNRLSARSTYDDLVPAADSLKPGEVSAELQTARKRLIEERRESRAKAEARLRDKARPPS